MNPHKIAFLKECQKISYDNFDNSDAVRESLENEFIYIEPKDQKSLWEKYRYLKFSYLYAAEVKNDDKANVVRQAQKEYNGDSNEFVAKWEENIEKEKLVYQLRVFQLPKEDVRDTWYSDVDSCSKWCNLQDTNLKQAEAEAIKRGKWGDALAEMYSIIGTTPITDHDTELRMASVLKAAITRHLQKAQLLRTHLRVGRHNFVNMGDTEPTGEEAGERLELIEKCLDCLSSPDSDRLLKVTDFDGKIVISGKNELLRTDFLGEMYSELIRTFFDNGFKMTPLILTFLNILKNEYPCEVCDYLIRDPSNKKLLSWKVATVGKDDLSPTYKDMNEDELIVTIRKNESYKRGQGISGSALLQKATPIDNQDILWYHLGSNNVEKDPRQSTHHVSVYQTNLYPGVLKNTKTICNFWMFPLFDKAGELRGAFRVVNRLEKPNGNLQPGGWVYTERVQLAAIAYWFSNFLNIIEPQITQGESYVQMMRLEQQVKQLREYLQINWLEIRSFKRLLDYLFKVTGLKEEKRSLGCCFFIANPRNGRGLLPSLNKDYPILSSSKYTHENNYNAFDSYLDIIDPQRGAFILNNQGRLDRIARLKIGSNVEGIEAIKNATNEPYQDCVCFLLPRESRHIRIYKKGQVTAELYISDNSGDWHIRKYDILFKKMKEFAPSDIKDPVLRIICDVCVQLSEKRLGAMFVIGQHDENEEKLQWRSVKIPGLNYDIAKIEEMGKDILLEFAKIDGTTFISKDGNVTRTGTLVHVIHKEKFDSVFNNRGSRHNTAELIARVSPEALVVVVSENGGISLLARGVRDRDNDVEIDL